MQLSKALSKVLGKALDKTNLKYLKYSKLGFCFLFLLLSDLSAQADMFPDTSLVELIVQGRLQRIKLYLRRNPESLEQKDSYGRRPLHYAVEWGPSETVAYFLARGANSGVVDHLGQNPLHYAAVWGRSEAAIRLLDHRENLLDLEDAIGRTALALAALHGQKDLVELLLQRGADRNRKDAYGWTPADLAFKGNHVRLGEFITKFGIPLRVKELSVEFGEPTTAIGENSQEKQEAYQADTTRPLLHEPSPLPKAWPAAPDFDEELARVQRDFPADSWTPYLLSAALNRVAILQNSPPDSQSAQLANGWNALQVAARSGALQALEYLLERFAVNELQAGKAALHLAIQAKQVGAVELLLDSGASVELADAQGFEPVHYAALYSPESLDILLRENPDLSRRMGPYGQSPLYLAAWKARVSALKSLLDSGAQVNYKVEWGPISAAIEGDYSQALQAVEVLLEGAEIKATSNFCGETPLHLAAKLGNVIVASRLLQELAVDFPSQRCGQTGLHLAAQNAQLPMGQLLLEHGANIEARDAEGNTPLLLAQTPSIARFLLENGANPAVENNAGAKVRKEFR